MTVGRTVQLAALLRESVVSILVTILIDDAIWPWRGRLWAHMVSDESLDELHIFAARLNLPKRAFGGDHYDVTDELRDCAIAEGAIAVDSRTVVRALYAAGLRKPPRWRAPASGGNDV